MKGKGILVVCFVIAVVALAVALLPGGTAEAMMPVNTVYYNLFSTDGYVPLVDGTVNYIYGFVGDRQGDGKNLIYQNRCTPGPEAVPGNPRTRTCDWPGISDFGGDAPVPSAGPWNDVNGEDQLAGNAQLPAPVIYARKGDIVEIRLKNLGVAAQPNAPNDPHSIHLHGLDVDAANDGVPETSLGAVPANLCADGTSIGQTHWSDEYEPNPGGPVHPDGSAVASCTGDVVEHGGPAPGAGNVIVYMFTEDQDGTYMYHCHQEADIHVQMGMYGALVVYEGNNMSPGTPGSIFGFNYDKDVIMLLTEVDLDYHNAEEGTYNPLHSNFHREWNPIDYHPQYWLVNGLSFPNTIHASTSGPAGPTAGPGVNYDEWILAHEGYDPFITGSASNWNADWGTKGDKVLVRMINLGFETQPMHVHGYHPKVLGNDQRPWDWANTSGGGKKNATTPFGQGLEKNTVTIGSGETYELLFDLGLQNFQSPYPNGTGGINGVFPGGTQSRYFDSLADVDAVDPGTCATDAAGLVPAPYEGQPVSNTFINCPVILDNAGGPGEYIAGPNVTGVVDVFELGPGAPLLPQFQFFPFHNHDDYKATNDGAYPGGQFTMIGLMP